MQNKDKTRAQLKLEFIKSGAILLLALILLLSAVFAWFGEPENPHVGPFSLKIEQEYVDSWLDEESIALRSLILPAVTKFDDSDISASDLAKVLVVKPLEVESYSSTVEVSLLVADGLNYYMDLNYIEAGEGVDESDVDTIEKYAEIIKGDVTQKEKINKSVTVNYTPEEKDEDGVNRHWIAVVFWGDYEKLSNDLITNGNLMLNFDIKLNSSGSDTNSETN